MELGDGKVFAIESIGKDPFQRTILGGSEVTVPEKENFVLQQTSNFFFFSNVQFSWDSRTGSVSGALRAFLWPRCD